MMKVQEIRETIRKYSPEKLQTIIVEMYKTVPKKVIEGKGIDAIIQSPDVVSNQRGKGKKPALSIDFDQLYGDAETFIEYAKKQYYFAPNSFVHKKDRPKWRFIAKRFFDQLSAFGLSTENEEDAADAADLLDKLYRLFSQACGEYLFSTTNPFQSMQTNQADCFRKMLALKRKTEKTNDWVEYAIQLLCDSQLDSETLYTDLMGVIMEFLEHAELKNMAAERCEQGLKGIHIRNDYKIRKKAENLTGMALMCRIGLHEYDGAVMLFKTYYPETNQEVKLYILLHWLHHFQLKELWVREYREAVDRGVKPRQQLAAAFQQIFELEQWPPYI